MLTATWECLRRYGWLWMNRYGDLPSTGCLEEPMTGPSSPRCIAEPRCNETCMKGGRVCLPRGTAATPRSPKFLPEVHRGRPKSPVKRSESNFRNQTSNALEESTCE